MDARSQDSTSTARTVAESSAGKEDGGEKIRDVEKGSPSDSTSCAVPTERDQDGVAIENGIPIVRLKGSDDPDS
jgi:hypothetical protein